MVANGCYEARVPILMASTSPCPTVAGGGVGGCARPPNPPTEILQPSPGKLTSPRIFGSLGHPFFCSHVAFCCPFRRTTSAIGRLNNGRLSAEDLRRRKVVGRVRSLRRRCGYVASKSRVELEAVWPATTAHVLDASNCKLTACRLRGLRDCSVTYCAVARCGASRCAYRLRPALSCW